MSNVRLITQNGFEQELQGVTILSIDGVPIEQILQPDITNHEHRIRVIELTLHQLFNPEFTVPANREQSEQNVNPVVVDSPLNTDLSDRKFCPTCGNQNTVQLEGDSVQGKHLCNDCNRRFYTFNRPPPQTESN